MTHGVVVVTGAAGFIGSTLAHRLAGAGHALVLVDHPLTADKQPNLVGLEGHPLHGHWAFLEALEAMAWPRVQAVFHLGACSRTTETNWDYLWSNNVAYSQRLWQWCATARCPMYYASSAATYGDGSLGFDDALDPRQLHPLNLYGRSKNDFDAWVFDQLDQGRAAPPAWAGLKFFNVYGPRETHKQGMHSVVLGAYRQIMATGEVRLFASNQPGLADGDQRRDFVWVGDCVDHLLWLWANPQAPSGLYNSGTGLARSFNDLARAVFAALGRPVRIRYGPMPSTLAGQYQNYTQAVMNRLWGVSGSALTPTGLEDGVARYVTALESHGHAVGLPPHPVG